MRGGSQIVNLNDLMPDDRFSFNGTSDYKFKVLELNRKRCKYVNIQTKQELAITNNLKVFVSSSTFNGISKVDHVTFNTGTIFPSGTIMSPCCDEHLYFKSVGGMRIHNELGHYDSHCPKCHEHYLIKKS